MTSWRTPLRMDGIAAHRLADQVTDLRLEFRRILSPVAVDFPPSALDPVPACRAPDPDRPVRGFEPLVRPAVHGGRDLARRQGRRDDPPGGRERPRYLHADFYVRH